MSVAVAALPSVKFAPVRVSVAATAAGAGAWLSVPVAATAPPRLRPVADNVPVVTPMLLLPLVLPSLKKTLSVFAVNTCPPL